MSQQPPDRRRATAYLRLPPIFATEPLIVRHDAHAFRLLWLWTLTKARCRNRGWWGGSSYSPLPVAGMKRSEERRVGKECVGRVDLGGRRTITKKMRTE